MHSRFHASSRQLLRRLAVAFALPLATLTAQTIAVPNGDFSTHNGSVGGTLSASTTAVIGGGAWTANTQGIASLLVTPTVTVGSGRASITGLIDVNLLGLGLVNNRASIYNDNIGTTFAAGKTYTLTVDFSSLNTLSASLLSNAGAGVALRANGVQTATTLGGGLASITLLTANTGRFTLNYTTANDQAGRNIGVELFAGRGNGLADLSLLSNIRYDNVSISAVGGAAAVPEPAEVALIIGAAGLACVMVRRVRRQRACAPLATSAA